jgi:3-oxoacyl-[acyl-carrier-protein] synthase-3
MIEVGSSRLNPRISHELIDQGRHWPVMDGKTIFKLAVQRLPEAVVEVLDKAGLELGDIDLFIPHQANLRINQFFAQSMKLPEDKVFNNIQRYGNTTAASIPIALDEALEMKIIGDGSTVVFLGLGAGVTWGAVVARLGH